MLPSILFIVLIAIGSITTFMAIKDVENNDTLGVDTFFFIGATAFVAIALIISTF